MLWWQIHDYISKEKNSSSVSHYFVWLWMRVFKIWFLIFNGSMLDSVLVTARSLRWQTGEVCTYKIMRGHTGIPGLAVLAEPSAVPRTGLNGRYSVNCRYRHPNGLTEDSPHTVSLLWKTWCFSLELSNRWDINFTGKRKSLQQRQGPAWATGRPSSPLCGGQSPSGAAPKCRGRPRQGLSWLPLTRGRATEHQPGRWHGPVEWGSAPFPHHRAHIDLRRVQ